MIDKAISVGKSVPQVDFLGTVHSVFDSAVYIKTEYEYILRTLVTKSAPDLPHGIRLEPPAGFTFDGLTVGNEVRRRGGLKYCGGLPWIIDLKDAQQWACDLSASKGGWSNPDISTAWDYAWSKLEARKAFSKLGEIIFSNSIDKPNGQIDIWKSMKESLLPRRNLIHRLSL